MTTYLDDLFDVIDLEQAIDAGYVREQVHPTLPFSIYNYTDRCTWERVWTPVTLQCRGLIVHRLTREVLARPYPKFFNSTESDAPKFGLDDHVTVTDKMDGSLGILYPTGDGGYAIATRGSFASDQAQHATVLWQDRYADRFRPDQCMTMLFEIVYRTNRIVVDYGDLDDLVLLGSVEIATGCSFDPGDIEAHGNWPGPKTKTFYYSTFREALEAEPRSGQEGLVVRRAFSEDRVKLKQDEYVALHRIVTGMNERVVWEHLGAGNPITDLLEPIPSEFHGWVLNVAARLIFDQEQIFNDAVAARDALVSSLPDGWTRKDYAIAAGAYGELRAYLFNLLDGRDPKSAIWKTLRPSGAVTMTANLEDAA